MESMPVANAGGTSIIDMNGVFKQGNDKSGVLHAKSGVAHGHDAVAGEDTEDAVGGGEDAAVGGGEELAAASGLNVNRVRILGFTLAGVCYAMG